MLGEVPHFLLREQAERGRKVSSVPQHGCALVMEGALKGRTPRASCMCFKQLCISILGWLYQQAR